mmetsp:Transcript_45801/g.97359  ORF Transcript_45801/g.97359 Transcript_45801/m.97359 type:complete len:203 (-) Transcript_45801:94-702(-)
MRRANNSAKLELVSGLDGLGRRLQEGSVLPVVAVVLGLGIIQQAAFFRSALLGGRSNRQILFLPASPQPPSTFFLHFDLGACRVHLDDSIIFAAHAYETTVGVKVNRADPLVVGGRHVQAVGGAQRAHVAEHFIVIVRPNVTCHSCCSCIFGAIGFRLRFLWIGFRFGILRRPDPYLPVSASRDEPPLRTPPFLDTAGPGRT